MCALVVSALILSTIGALVQRGLAAGLGVPARLVLGLGPRLGDASAPPRALELRPVLVWAWTPLEGGARARRAIVRAAGPLAILLVPFTVLVASIAARGVPDEAPPGRMVVGEVVAGSPADEAGIARGDVIVSVEGAPVRSVADIAGALEGRAGTTVHVVRERGGARETLEVVPEATGGRARIGVGAEPRWRAVGIGEAIALGARIVGHQLQVIVETFLPGGQRDAQVMGPVAMVRHVAEATPDGATRVALIAAAWTSFAAIWSIAAALSELVRELRGRP